MFDNKWQKKEMPLVSLIGMGGGIASPAFLASIVLNILKPTVFSPVDDSGVPDFDYTAESSAITNVNQIQGGWSSVSFDSNAESGNNQWTATAYGNGKYVALGKVGNAYLAANSTDGINWTSYNTIPYTSYSELAYGNGVFVAVGQNKISYSTDEGQSWSSASVTSNWYKGVVYGGGKFVAVSEDGVNARVAISSDGINWTGIPDTDGSSWQAITYGGGKFVAVSHQGDVMYSSDGMNWSTTSPAESSWWNSVAYGNGRFVAVDTGFGTMYSTDGINWFSGNNTVGYWNDITFGDGRFVAVSNYQNSTNPYAAGHSTDGETWTPSSQAIPNTWNGVDYVNGRFIAVASGVVDGSRMMWSPTGIDESTELTLTDTTVSKVSDGSLIGGTSIDQVLTVGETVQADTTISSTVAVPVFNATTYTGNGGTMSISTGIDLTTKGLLWFCGRNGSGFSNTSHGHFLFDSERNNYGDYLKTSDSDRQMSFADYGWEPQPDVDGTVSNLQANLSANNINWVNWAFRAAPGFFDVVTYTGQYTYPDSFAVPHSLGSVPGMIVIKNINMTSGWTVWHKNLSSTTGKALDFLYTNAEDSHAGFFPTAPTSTEFYLGDNSNINQQNQSYVAYVFADTPGVIKCGTYTGTGSSQTIDTGFKPKFVLTKSRSHSSDWYLMDSARPGKALYANQTQQDQSVPIGYVNNGFTVDGANFALNASGYEYIYMAIAEDAEVDITSDIRASGTVSASTGNTVTLSDVSGTWSTGMKVQGTDSDTKDNPDPISAENVSLTSSAPTAEKNVNTWGDAVWEIATDENFTQNVQIATSALSATGTQAGPSFTLEPNTGYYTRTKYTALGQESEWSDVTYFVTKEPSVYVDDVFSTFLYDGTGSTQSINNGIDLSGEGGLVWIKRRTFPGSTQGFHMLYDTERGATKALSSNDSDVENTRSGGLTAFNSNGFTVGNFSHENNSGDDVCSWTFRKAPGFFDVVTYTGNGGSTGGAGDDGSNSRDVPHNLGTTPGMILVKCVDNSGGWFVWHKDYQNTTTDWMSLSTTGGVNSHSNMWGDVNASSFGVTNRQDLNNDGLDYVAYVFAHDDARFGTNGDESIIKCGSYNTPGDHSAVTVDLGFEPQFILFKSTANAGRSWFIFDTARGITSGGYSYDQALYPNTTDTETSRGIGDFLDITPTGFIAQGGEINYFNAQEKVVYMAIRRPHKPATVATDVFNPTLAYASDGFPQTMDVGFPPDFILQATRDQNYNYALTRLLGDGYFETSTTNSFSNLSGSGFYAKFDDQNSIDMRVSSSDSVYYNFRRAPGFMDVVTYIGNGNSGQVVNHNLGVTPEMVIIKGVNWTTEWFTYHTGLLPAGYRHIDLNQSYSASNDGGAAFALTPTTITFDRTYRTTLNTNNQKNVAFLFATLDGISKVGSYSGTGNNVDIDCGFTSGARFVLIKRIDSHFSDWYIWDSARGITSGNDPYLLLNTIGSDVNDTDYIDPLNAGFTVTSSAPDTINASGGEYIFLAIA